MEDRGGSVGKIVFGLFGAGGFGREVMPIFRVSAAEEVRGTANAVAEIYFVEDNPTRIEVNGHRVMSTEDFLNLECHAMFYNIAISDSRVRQEFAERCFARRARPLLTASDRALVYDKNSIGEGAILCANTVITSNVRIGKFFHANIYSYVAHDCVVGDYVTFAPNVHCNGNVHIGDHAYIGAGAVLKQGSQINSLKIGEGAVVGMGAVVTKDVPPNVTVVGNPARLFEKR